VFTPPHLSKEDFGAGLTTSPIMAQGGGLTPLNWRTHFLKMFTTQKMFSWVQINPGSTGYLSSLIIKWNFTYLKARGPPSLPFRNLWGLYPEQEVNACYWNNTFCQWSLICYNFGENLPNHCSIKPVLCHNWSFSPTLFSFSPFSTTILKPDLKQNESF